MCTRLSTLTRFLPTLRPAIRGLVLPATYARHNLSSSQRRVHSLTLRPSRTFATTTTVKPSMAPHDGSESLSGRNNVFGNFDLVKRVHLDFTPVTVSRWKSRATGLTVVHLDYEAPIVNGYFTVATEIFDDTGCPHTLEHLVFMGSEKYPYKGIIDQLANLGFSNGTNAWTDTDHTAYTVSTAGQQGFLQILPIYVDHILYPTMTKAGFVTEVHHIDAEGEDSGVVYSEMQGRENTSGDLMALRMQRLINPPGNAYRSETGGLMEALRNLTVEQIRNYHSTYYVPHNFVLIVAGKLAGGTNSLLSVVQNEVEPTLIAHGQNQGPKPGGWKRPFLETPSANRTAIEKTIKETVEFPEQDESSGELMIGFMGSRTNDLLESQALDHLGTYLTSSPTAPLNKEYIETESPLCTYIYFNEDARATRNDLCIYVGSVPTEHLETFDSKLDQSFKRIAKEGIDMKRMRMVIDRDERQVRSRLESNGGDAFSHAMISLFLYGKEDGSDIEELLSEFRFNDQLRNWTSQQWSDLITKYYITPERVVVRGKPSAAMADRLEREEKARIAKQRESLGEEGLSRMAKELEEAKAEHDRPIPKEILTSFPIPDVKSISWIPVQSKQEIGTGRSTVTNAPDGSSTLDKLIDADGSPLPFFVQYDHVKSDFVNITALLSLSKLPNQFRPHISVYLASFFSLPVVRHTGERLSHEDVVNRLDDETVSYEATLGVSGLVPETFRISFRVQIDKYEAAVAWLHDLIYGAEFDRERLQINIAQIQSGLPSLKRDGNNVLSSISAGLLFDENSTSSAVSIVPQTEFVPKLVEQLKENPRDVINTFNAIRRIITEPSGVRFSVSGNVLGLTNPRSVWSKYFKSSLPESPLDPVPYSSRTLSKIGKEPVKKAIVVSLPTIESSFVTYTGKGICGWTHEDYAALRVSMEVLSATESYLWRYIRGSGLAYGAYVSADTEAGHVSFSLYRSSNSLKAAEQGATVVRGLVDGTIELDKVTLDAAKSSIVFAVTRSVSNPGRAALMSFTNQALKGVPQRHNIDLLERFQSVTIDDVIRTLRTYFLPLFDPQHSVVVSVTAPGKVDEVAQGLDSLGYDVERRTLDVDPDEGSESESGGSESESES